MLLDAQYSLCGTTFFAQARGHALITWIGFRIAGLLRAIVFPTALTASLFAGPLALKYFDGIVKQCLLFH